MNLEERPREKALRYGVDALSNRELIALLLRGGVMNHSVLEVADDVLHLRKNLAELQNVSYFELCEIHGISKVKAMELLSVFELMKRMNRQQCFDQVFVGSPQLLVGYLNQKIGFLDQEHFLVLFLGTKNQILFEKVLFIGTLDRSLVNPREIYKEAVRLNSSKIICVHNHPSGDCTPSDADYVVTNAISDVGEMMGIPLLDHLIVGHNSYFSFREKNLIQSC